MVDAVEAISVDEQQGSKASCLTPVSSKLLTNTEGGSISKVYVNAHGPARGRWVKARDLKGQQVPGVQSACEHEVIECDGVTSHDFVLRCQMDGLWVPR